MSESSLYQQLVLDHYRNPRHRGALVACTHAADGVNALCGDRLRVELEVDAGGRIAAMRCSGEACAIATATASMLSELAGGWSLADVDTHAARFVRMLGGDRTAATFGDLDTMAELARFPARRKCALLPWATLRAALGGTARASTEGAPA